MRRAFTLIELCFVLALLAAFTAMAVPVYDGLLKRTWAAEATSVLTAIAHAELRHHRDHGSFLACPAAGPIPSPVQGFPGAADCWRTLGVDLSGAARFRYGVELHAAGFTATAEADLDRDGQASRYALDGTTMAIVAQDPLE
ncbi:MAG: prepilin-type N-terminal cleavage/methylation domain-containing protein [Deltaproteobacteria bacterium]|nr:prepilin-type N-terminal cleavage/methylation domain-containing protein [Deltaproteobacteria bacterium]